MSSDQDLRAVLLFDTMQQRDEERRRADRYEAMAIIAFVLLAVAIAIHWYTVYHLPINCPALA